MYFNKKKKRNKKRPSKEQSCHQTTTQTHTKAHGKLHKKHTQFPLFNNIYEITIVLMNAHARKQQLKCIYYY